MIPYLVSTLRADIHAAYRPQLAWLSTLLAGWLTLANSANFVFSADIDFAAQVLPILSQHCYACHGPDASARVSDFRLDSLPAAMAELSDGPGISPGDSQHSLILSRIKAVDPEERMPPAEAGPPLTTIEIELLTQWIAAGANYDTHWAWRPIQRPRVPIVEITDENPVEQITSDVTDIDRFVISALRQAGLALSPGVDKRTLLRRLTFDLTGLPPTWEEILDFEADNTDDAYARVVDRLLASPQYGVRWGRHWLDIARYADTHGGGATGVTRFAFSYTYRDYVIAALNRDLPYDRFLTEQIAADQLGLDEHDAALAGLGFLTVGRQYPSMHDIIDDRIDVVSRGLMGMTVACARCHDHKYDAISTRDYYALYATFASSRAPSELPTLIDHDTEPQARAEYDAELRARQFQRQEMIREQSEVLRQRLRMQVGLYLKELVKGTPEQDLAVAFLSYRTDDYRPLVLDRWRDYLAQLDGDDPVFGMWHRLYERRELAPAEFSRMAGELVTQLSRENGEADALKLFRLATQPTRWNPRVLTAIQTRNPQSMLDVAETYGDLFAAVQVEWLSGLNSAACEARREGAVVPDEDEAHTTINSSVNRQLRYHLHAPSSPTALSDEVASVLLNRPVNDHVSGLAGAIDNLNLNSAGSPPRAMSLLENSTPPRSHIFLRGNPLARGEIVEPSFLRTLSADTRSVFRDGQRRLDLAGAITDRSNPLTRRVVVNWVWQRHFGMGLVRTPDDFGIRGDPPTHPELLDYLADTFLIEDQWSLKRLHRRIVLTRVYQQASLEIPAARQIDPENRLLWRMPRRRLEVEAMRDAMLAAAGQIDFRMGGRPNDLFTEPFTSRRSVYGFINRDVIAGFFSAFDMADPSVCAAKRPQTTVPQQTLFALNSSFIQEQALHLIQHTEFVGADNAEQRIVLLYRRVLSRSPSDVEIEDALQFVTSQPAGYEAQAAWQSLAHVLLAANEFLFLD